MVDAVDRRQLGLPPRKREKILVQIACVQSRVADAVYEIYVEEPEHGVSSSLIGRKRHTLPSNRVIRPHDAL